MSLDELFAFMKLDGERRTVLVVEDHVPLLKRLTEICETRGHLVIGLLGVADINGGVATGPGLENEVSFSLRSIEAAFLDHYFLSNRHNGRSLTHELRRKSDAKILGMSSSASANESMLRAGADRATIKSELLPLVGLD